MNIFRLFNVFKSSPGKTVRATLDSILEYVPAFYRESKHYNNSIEFLKHTEYGLAVESLIEMAVESGHYFSETFWTELATCADKMMMTKDAQFCMEQITRNQQEIGNLTPNGWTTIKIDDQTLQHHIAEITGDYRSQEFPDSLSDEFFSR